MKTRWIRGAALILILLTVTAAASAYAVSPFPAARTLSGKSPADALVMTCNWESLPPTSDVWYQVPRRDDKPFLIRLVSYPRTLQGMEFQVYRDEGEGQAGEPALSAPVGQGQVADSRLVQEWRGTPIRGATYYVQVFNHSSHPVEYGLCDPYRRMSPLQEWE